MKKLCLLLFSTILFLNCQNATDSAASADQKSGSPTTPEDLPQPANETAELSLNGVRHTLLNKLDCKNGAAGIGLSKSPTEDPFFFLHGVDLSAIGDVTIRTGSNPLAWHLDLDLQTGTFGTEAAGCRATIVENTTTIFELKATACPIRQQFGGAATGTLSFRLRCTKGT